MSSTNLGQLSYLPLPAPFFAALVACAGVLLILVQLNALRFAYERIGLGPIGAFLVLGGSLVGSYFNLPITTWPGRQVHAQEAIPFFGMRYVVPVVLSSPGTILAVNVGGAIIPGLVSLYLMLVNALVPRALLAIAVVATVTHMLAQPVEGLGIALPMFVPAAATAVTALVLSGRRAAPLAYIGGSMGTLVGADLLNLDKITGMGASVASIGGAGTFDGIFLTGVLAVLIASIPAGLFRPSTPSR